MHATRGRDERGSVREDDETTRADDTKDIEGDGAVAPRGTELVNRRKSSSGRVVTVERGGSREHRLPDLPPDVNCFRAVQFPAVRRSRGYRGYRGEAREERIENSQQVAFSKGTRRVSGSPARRRGAFSKLSRLFLSIRGRKTREMNEPGEKERLVVETGKSRGRSWLIERAE